MDVVSLLVLVCWFWLEPGMEILGLAGKAGPPRRFQANPAFEGVSAQELPRVSGTDLVAPLRPLFEEVPIEHQHHEEPFDDFARQPLLPNRLSQLGPGVSWIDLFGGGRECLVIGASKGGTMAILTNDGATFRAIPLFPRPLTRDQTTILPLPKADGTKSLLAGSANYEDGLSLGGAARLLNPENGQITDAIPGQASSTGPMALADLDGNGDLELFVGGRVIPNRYPEAATSLIFEWRDGAWALDEANSAPLKEVGMVSGAVWTDLNGDGFAELALACEWGPLKIFQNHRGRLREATKEWGLEKYKGWWNGVTAGDFDGDGRMDLAASNWGLNTKYRASEQRPRRVYYAPWGIAGEIEPVESFFDEDLSQWVPDRGLNSLGRALPFVREKFRLHRDYARASVEQILGERFNQARLLEANWLETSVFLNRGDHFNLAVLPLAAQLTPCFGVNVADFDGDGHEDIFFSQNFFSVQPQTSRNDAGRGLLVQGDGRGQFREMPATESGIQVYGEQRGSAVADFDRDGRADLAVAQNGAATRLFRNAGAKPGLRVRLRGTKGNPDGIGAVLRLRFGADWGPAREIHCGSGYWSHDSSVQVLALPKTPTQLEVKWPGGKTTLANVPAGSRELAVDEPGPERKQ